MKSRSETEKLLMAANASFVNDRRAQTTHAKDAGGRALFGGGGGVVVFGRRGVE